MPLLGGDHFLHNFQLHSDASNGASALALQEPGRIAEQPVQPSKGGGTLHQAVPGTLHSFSEPGELNPELHELETLLSMKGVVNFEKKRRMIRTKGRE
jgi:Tat protein secretion system quality control protein TatD with DNase activity